MRVRVSDRGAARFNIEPVFTAPREAAAGLAVADASDAVKRQG